MIVFVENMEVAQTRGPSPIWPQISQVLRNMLQEVGTGVSAKEAVANGAAAMQEYIDQ